MINKRWMRGLALLFAFSLIAASCGDDDDDTTTTDEAGGEGDTTTTVAAEGDTGGTAEVNEGDGVLRIGTLLPETGDLAFLGPPEINGVRVAVADINAAGGVLGADVELSEGDSGDTTTETAQQTTDRLLSEGVDAIVGAASSAVTKTVIDRIVAAGVIQFSPANTSPDFTTYDDNGLYFRTAPSDVLQGRVLADVVLGDGNETAAVLYRQESYGEGLANAFRDTFEAAGGTIPEGGFRPYAVDTDVFDTEVDAIVELDVDAIILISFDEAANILVTMNEKGIGPLDKAVYGADGFGPGVGVQMEDPSIIAGLRYTTPSVDLSTITSFTDRLEPEGGLDNQGTFAYAAEAYDATIIVALAAVMAGTDRPADVAAAINDVTGGGDKCTTFAECIELVDGGSTDIDYDGIGGQYEFVEAGEPAAASFQIGTYDGTYADPEDPEAVPGAAPNPDLYEYVFAAA